MAINIPDEEVEKFKNNMTSYFDAPLQGCLGWMLCREALFNNFDIRELPITDQLCCLLQARMPQGIKVLCEESYSKIMMSAGATGHYSSNSRLLKDCRADIIIKKDNEILAVIEVKRYKNKCSEDSTNIKGIEEDIRQLAAIKQESPHIRTFEFIIASKIVPTEFVECATGRAKKIERKCFSSSSNPLKIKDYMTYRPIRSLSLVTHKISKKATKSPTEFEQASKKLFSEASYACIVEVFRKNP